MTRRNKYGVSPKELRTTQDGIVFDSRGEMKRWQNLRLWALAGEIRNLRRQVKYDLASPDAQYRVLTKTGKQAVFTADFVYERKLIHPGGVDWNEVIEDFKGMTTREAELRIRVFEALSGKKVTITNKRTRG